jgi:L-fuculose-phosphate aldolase
MLQITPSVNQHISRAKTFAPQNQQTINNTVQHNANAQINPNNVVNFRGLFHTNQTLKAKKELIQVAKMMFDRNLTAGTGGNISCKCGDKILISGTKTCLGTLTPKDISVVDKTGKLISGPPPSSELPVHMAAYAQRDDIGAVIHSHSPYIRVYAVANQPLAEDILPECTKNFGTIPCEPYHFPGSDELASETTKHLKNNNVVIMGNHGLLAAGKDLMQAFKFTDAAEQLAQVSYLVNHSNLPKNSFTPEQVAKIRGQNK